MMSSWSNTRSLMIDIMFISIDKVVCRMNKFRVISIHIRYWYRCAFHYWIILKKSVPTNVSSHASDPSIFVPYISILEKLTLCSSNQSTNYTCIIISRNEHIFVSKANFKVVWSNWKQCLVPRNLRWGLNTTTRKKKISTR